MTTFTLNGTHQQVSPGVLLVQYARFTVTTGGTITIDAANLGTGANGTDAEIFLFTSSGVLVASDQDSGDGLNARLSLNLSPGNYFLAISDYGLASDGSYLFTEAEALQGWNLTDDVAPFGFQVTLTEGTGRTTPLIGAADEIFADSGAADTHYGLDGNDSFSVSVGSDTIHGGAGTDTLTVDYSLSSLDIRNGPFAPIWSVDQLGGFTGYLGDSAGRGVNFSSIERFLITTGSGNDNLRTGNGNDVVQLGAGDDFVDVGGGQDMAVGGAGQDGISADLSAATGAILWNIQTDSYSGPIGSFTGFEYFGTILTGSGNDVVVTTNLGASEVVDLGAGDDSVSVFSMMDKAYGGSGIDTLIVNWGETTGDVIVFGGLSGPGYSMSAQWSDSYATNRFITFYDFEKFDITTGSGNDNFYTAHGDDRVSLGLGNDFVDLGQGKVILDGGGGEDGFSADFSNFNYLLPVDIDLRRGVSQNGNYVQISGMEYFGAITGTISADVIIGTSADRDETISLGGGDDLAGVFAGFDTVDGGYGNDRLLVDWSSTTGAVVASVSFTINFSTGGYDGEWHDSGASTRRITFTSIENFELRTGSGNDVLRTALGDDVVYSGAGNDLVSTAGGNDFLDGGVGADHLTGGGGDDTYVVDAVGDTVVEEVEGGLDTVRSWISYTLGQGLENLTLIGSSLQPHDPINGTGNSVNNVLVGNEASNLLWGLAGNDTLIGGGGNDTTDGGTGDDIHLVEDAGDVVIERVGEGRDSVYATISYTLSAGVEAEILALNDAASTAALNLTGNAFGQFIYGNGGANTLIGGGGADVLIGAAGNDMYLVDGTDDVVFDNAGQGYDQVFTTGSHNLRADAEIEVFAVNQASSTNYIEMFGNGFSQLIYGNAGSNMIVGGGGADVLIGYAGDDNYLVDGYDDVVIEAAGQGRDGVYTTGSTRLAADAEIEVFGVNDASTSNAVDLFGNGYGQLMYGNAGANMLVGGGGADILVGYGGNDLYLVDGQDDVVFEGVGGGTDGVYTTASHNLRADAEIELFAVNDASTANQVDLFGNAFSQSIFGNAGNNMIIGGGGNDLMVGYGGNDTYLVDSQSDVVVEGAGGGYDRVYSTSSYALSADAQIELLSVNDNGSVNALNLTGNGFAQTIYGNAGANVIAGGGGNDILYGLGGADSFLFDTQPGSGNADFIGDFFSGSDKILLDDAVFAGMAFGALSANAFVQGSQATTADHRIIYNANTGELFYDADGSGAGAAVHFASVQPFTSLQASDFAGI